MNDHTKSQEYAAEHYIKQAQILYRSLSKSIARYIEAVDASLESDIVPKGDKEKANAVQAELRAHQKTLSQLIECEANLAKKASSDAELIGNEIDFDAARAELRARCALLRDER
ncbi:hypothetical protein FHS89_002558 [Rubricella aquisinus]|uniref:Uncharacterized protein n=1 Tax=Rubricella aquisinus TaxID=2028108 RepID=A0A840X745_9RHOB|nr:hypothetical protein [Rubricella aquisinus]MBB5516527.1 hypothetical protein [Rubricella aquisinus]